MIQSIERTYRSHVQTDGRFMAAVNLILAMPVLACALFVDTALLLGSKKGTLSMMETLFKCKNCGRLTWHQRAYWYPPSSDEFKNFDRYFERSYPYCPRCSEPLQLQEAVKS